MLYTVMRCDMNFFESTPIGRILNRFNKDIETIEFRLPEALRNVLRVSYNFLLIVIVISINSPIFLVTLVPILILYLFIQVD